jgi:hypothetical protein
MSSVECAAGTWNGGYYGPFFDIGGEGDGDGEGKGGNRGGGYQYFTGPFPEHVAVDTDADADADTDAAVAEAAQSVWNNKAYSSTWPRLRSSPATTRSGGRWSPPRTGSTRGSDWCLPLPLPLSPLVANAGAGAGGGRRQGRGEEGHGGRGLLQGVAGGLRRGSGACGGARKGARCWVCSSSRIWRLSTISKSKLMPKAGSTSADPRPTIIIISSSVWVASGLWLVACGL